MSLTRLPDELIEVIAFSTVNLNKRFLKRSNNLDNVRALSSTCRQLFRIVYPIVYKIDVERFGSRAIDRIIKEDRADILHNIVHHAPQTLQVVHITKAVTQESKAVFDVLIAYDRLWDALVEAKGWDEEHDSPLVEAAEKGFAHGAKGLLEKGGTSIMRPAVSREPLKMALRYGHPGIAKLILHHGGPAKSVFQNDSSTLMDALQYGYNDVAILLMERGCDPLWIQYRGLRYSGFKRPMMAHNVPLIRTMLEYGAGRFEPAKLGATICYATYGRGSIFYEDFDHTEETNSKSVEIVRLLVERGANLNDPWTNDYGREDEEWTTGAQALYCFICQRNMEGVELMLEHGVSPNAHGGDCLRRAVMMGDLHMVKKMAIHGADILGTVRSEFRDQPPTTLLRLAVSKNRLEIVKYLVERGADVQSSLANGPEILRFLPCLEIMEYLLQRGADPNVITIPERHQRLLHFAVLVGDVDKVALLIQFGADVRATTTDGKTPLDKALESNSHEVAALLRSHGAE